jgi:hypothetical protein
MNPDDYWFRKKRFGWGWGAPNNVHGWLFLIVWGALIIFGARTLRGISGVIFLIGMLSVLGMVLYFRGEPPGRGRWD